MFAGHLGKTLLTKVLSSAATLGAAIAFAIPAHAQQFPNPSMIVTAPDPVAVVTADFNNDGNPDLAYVATGDSPTLHLLLGNGKGGFAEGVVVALPAGACVVTTSACRAIVGDFTHSGHPGILMPGNFSAGWGFAVLPGNGDGTFASPIVSVVPASSYGGETFIPFQSAVADFNGDGNLDIAAPDFYNGRILILIGDGKGDFTQGAILNDFYQPYAIYTADVNHDGNADLIAFNEENVGNGGAQIWIGDGTGNFTAQTNSISTPSFLVRTVADINGDGNVDLVGWDGLGDVQTMLGNANGTFNAPQTFATGFEPNGGYLSAIYLADLTGSGNLDILMTSLEGFDTAVATGKMTYGAVQKRTSGPFATSIAVADFNKDGAPDFAAGVAGGIQLFFGNSAGTFPDSTITPTAVPSTFLFAGDFKGDGVADVAALGTDGYVRTYPGSKSGTFQAPIETNTALNTAFDLIGNTVGDFDGDGHQDIALRGQVLYGNGDGTFNPVNLTTVSNGRTALVTDLNKDGKSDLLSISGLQSGTGSYNFFYSLVAQLGTAQRTFTQVTTNLLPYTVGAGITTPALLAVADLNGDGYPDTTVYDANVPALETWLGNGDGSFHLGSEIGLTGSTWFPQGAGGQQYPQGTAAIADIDGDGNPDLMFLANDAAPDSSIASAYVLVIEYGDGKGGFAASQIIPLSHPFVFMTLATLDSSGHPGIVLGNSTLLSAVRNLGGRQFSNEEFYTAGSMTGVVAADFNGDGLSDLFAVRSNPLESPNPGALGFTVLMNQAEAGGNGAGISNGALTVTPAVVSYNQSFTLTALLQRSIAAAPVPTGTVAFTALGISLGSSQLNGKGTASVQVPGTLTQSLPPGIITIQGNYSGDSYYASSDLSVTVQVLNPVYATQTNLTLTAAGSSVGSVQATSFVTFNVVVTAPQTVPEGYVAFYDGSTVLGQAKISNGQASFATNLLSIGSHSLSAQYLGYTPPNAQAGIYTFQPSTSNSVALTVTAVPTNATLTPSSSSVTAGAVLTLTAALTSGSGSPIGGVAFWDGSTWLGAITLDSNGTAAFSTASLAVGSHSITAQYTANDIFAASVAAPMQVTIAAASPQLAQTTTRFVSVIPSGGGQSVATILVSGEFVQTGTVSLLVDGQLASTAALGLDGEAVVPMNLTGTAVHTIIASYGGNALTAPSESPQLQTTAYLGGADFIVQAANAQYTASSPGAQIAIPLNIGALGGFSGTVSLRCASGLPEGYSCLFLPSSVSGSGSTTLVIQPSALPPISALVFVPLLWFLRRSRRSLILSLLLLAGLLISGCARTPSTSTTAYVVSIQATSGSQVHSVQVGIKIAVP
jgi:hypothetical protein